MRLPTREVRTGDQMRATRSRVRVLRLHSLCFLERYRPGVVFTDSAFEAVASSDDITWVEAPPGFRSYSYWAGATGQSALTIHGMEIGSTVSDLQALGDAVTFEPLCGMEVGFTISDPDSASGGRIYGDLLGVDSEDFGESGYLNPDARVSTLSAGAQSSC